MPHQFADVEGQSWPVKVTPFTLGRVKRETGHNLMDLLKPDTTVLAELQEDCCVLFAIAESLLRPEIEKRALTPEKFGECLNAESLEAFAHALMLALFDYLPAAKACPLRDAYMMAFQRAKKSQREAIETLTKFVGDPEYEQALERTLCERLEL